MADDKLIALLLNALLDAYAEGSALRAMVMTYRDHFPRIGDWEKDLEELKTRNRPNVERKFAPLRDAVARSREVEAALEQFLKGTPPKGPVQ